MELFPEQCRAARSLLNWSQQKLAEESDVGVATIRTFETGKTTPQKATLKVLALTLSELVELIPENGGGAGVRLRKQY